MILKWRTKEDVQQYLSTLQQDSKTLIRSIISLIYFMRGSLSYAEAMEMSYAERQIVSDFIEDRLKTESKNPYPVY